MDMFYNVIQYRSLFINHNLKPKYFEIGYTKDEFDFDIKWITSDNFSFCNENVVEIVEKTLKLKAFL